MSSVVTHFRTDAPNIASELFDGEVVIAHYGSGQYYSVSQCGGLIWQGLRCGLSTADIANWLGQHFSVGTEPMQAQVEAFAARLSSEGLLIEADPPETVGTLPVISVAGWQEPLLERFDDMQELLLLDPVHDVTEAGWPHRRDDTA